MGLPCELTPGEGLALLDQCSGGLLSGTCAKHRPEHGLPCSLCVLRSILLWMLDVKVASQNKIRVRPF
jgi:hypothetical protein